MRNEIGLGISFIKRITVTVNFFKIVILLSGKLHVGNLFESLLYSSRLYCTIYMNKLPKLNYLYVC